MRRKERYRLPVTIMRGETSKGIYILESELPDNRDEWEPLLLRLMGSLDKKQIDGLGGSQPVTSKAAILYDRDFAIAGVLGTAAPIRLTFTKPAGTLGWGLLPTGNAVDILEVPGAWGQYGYPLWTPRTLCFFVWDIWGCEAVSSPPSWRETLKSWICWKRYAVWQR